MFQDKAQTAENGLSFSRIATRYWDIWEPPFGRVGKWLTARRVSQVMAWSLPRGATPRTTTSQLAEPVVITLKEH
jgi:hypothetical protein